MGGGGGGGVTSKWTPKKPTQIRVSTLATKCVNYFDRLVDKSYNIKWITAKDADEAKKEYFKFITAIQNEHKDAFS